MPRVSSEHIQRCADHIRHGELVAFPTETVYGLGGDATQSEAIAKIYALKNRPSFNPLICHIASTQEAEKLGVFSMRARELAEKFWPGPLTLVVPRRADCPISPLASAGLDSIALRVPHHEMARQLLDAVARPLVAPSANPSGTLSPTRAQHVETYFPDLLILDGGPCTVGLESSIVGCVDDRTYWLRAGGIAKSEIETAIRTQLSPPPSEHATQARLSPGRLLRHYAPRHTLLITEQAATKNDAVILFGNQHDPAARQFNLSPSGSDIEAASRLYALLHEIDQELPETGLILVRPFAAEIAHESGLYEALLDRLQRAAQMS